MLMLIAVSVGLAVLNAGLTYLMSSKSDPPTDNTVRAGGPKRFVPFDGDPIPVVFGTVDIAPAVVWQGSEVEVDGDGAGGGTVYSADGSGAKITSISPVKKLTALPIHWVISAGPIDKISEVHVHLGSERALTLWGEDSPDFKLPVTGIGSAPEGVLVRWGLPGRPVDPDSRYTEGTIEATVLPGLQESATTGFANVSWSGVGFRHVTSMAGLLVGGEGSTAWSHDGFRGPAGAVRMRVTRIYSRSEGRPEWYSEKSTLDGVDMNPVHVLYHILTDKIWGPLHLDDADIDDASFRAAADIMYDEGIFMSARISSSEDTAAFISQIFSLCNATPYIEPTTGKYAIAVATGGYDVGSLISFGDSNSSGELVRQYAKNMTTRMTVKYTKRYKRSSTPTRQMTPLAPDEERTFSQTDAAGYERYGEVELTHDYKEIRISKTASKIATRDLLQSSRPLAALSVRVAWSVPGARDLRPGDLFIWGSEISGIDPIVFRVTAIDFGAGSDSSVHIEAIEDAFAFPDALEPSPPESQWEPPENEPEPATPRVPFQLPLWMWYQLDLETNPYALLADHKDAGARPYALAAGRPAPGSRDFALHVDGVTRLTRENFTTFYTTAASVSQTSTTVVLADDGASLDFGVGFTPIIMIGEELMEVTAWNAATKTATVCRGWLDTVPSFSEHPAGSDVAVLGALYDGGSRFVRQFSTDNRLTSSSNVEIKALTRTSLGTLSPADAPTDALDMLPFRGSAVLPRSLLPIPPARMRTTATGADVVLTWSVRERLSAPECDNFNDTKLPIDITYSIEVSKVGGPVVIATDGISDRTWTLTQTMQGDNGIGPSDDIVFTLWTVDASGRESWQKYTRLHTR